MDNWSGLRKNVYYFYSRFLLIGFIASMSLGCATRHTLEDVAGERAEYKFRVIDSDIAHPMIHWIEKPRHIETALRLDPQLESCEQITIYANRYPASPIKLSEGKCGVKPVDLLSRDDEMATWNNIPSRECVLLVTLGTIREDLFTGVSISTYDGVINRHRTVIQGRLKGRPSQLGWLMFSGIYDYIYSPFYVIGGAIDLVESVPTKPVAVIFEFPDGQVAQTILTNKEVNDLLGSYYPNVLSMPDISVSANPLGYIRTWARAAIAKLYFEFTEETTGHAAHDEWIPDSLDLKMINRYWGNWKYTVNERENVETNIAKPIGDSHIIRFSLEK